MISIIKHGKPDIKPIRRFICKKCKCVFKTNEYDYGNNVDGSRGPIYVTCPECDNRQFNFK